MYSQAKKVIAKKDYEILDLLLGKPCIKVKELSEKTQISRVTLRRRLKFYERRKMFRKKTALNKDKLDVVFAIISANFKSVQALEGYIKRLKKCPHVLTLITNVAQYDLITVIYGNSEQQTRSFFLNNFYSEDITFKSFLHVPKNALILPQFISIKLPNEKQCDKDCRNCKFYKDGLCSGCIFRLKLHNLLKSF